MLLFRMFIDVFNKLIGSIDIQDISIILIGLLSFLYYNLVYRVRIEASKNTTSVVIRSSTHTTDLPSFIDRMKLEGRETLILYGSQTGTAEELAGRLHKDLSRYGKKGIIMDPEEIDAYDLAALKNIPNVLLILCMATYGEGDPPDNVQQLHDNIVNEQFDLDGVRYAVFGLGNKTYAHFNAAGKFFDRRFEELGGIRIYELGLGNDDGNLEEDFMRWREGFWSAICREYDWEVVADAVTEREYRYAIISDPSTALFTGEYGVIGAYVKHRPPFDSKNPFLATVDINNELHKEKSERSCRHIEFDTSETRIRYEVGDHLGVYPVNDYSLVEELGRLLDINMDEAFRLITLDVDSSKRHPFPCPCTIRTAFMHYVDICSPAKSNVLRVLADYTDDNAQKQQLILMSTATDEGLKAYSSFIQKKRRSIIDVLRYFDTCKPAVDHLLELLPRLQPRYYSISSSIRAAQNRIAVTVVVTRYMIDDRLMKGVCSNFLLEMMKNEKVPVFVRKSNVRLPHRLTAPVIMIGPGTGLAPFRGFLQERSWQKNQGKELGQMYLFFGCRHPEQDFLYEEELEQYVGKGVLTKLEVAFSRLEDKKVYVQDKLWSNREILWQAIMDHGYIYVCGDARNMARDVKNTFLKIFVECGKKSESEALKFLQNLEEQRRYQADVWS